MINSVSSVSRTYNNIINPRAYRIYTAKKVDGKLVADELVTICYTLKQAIETSKMLKIKNSIDYVIR